MSRPVRPRKPVLALLLSLIQPGFGQLYNGEPKSALRLALAYCALNLIGLTAAALYLPYAQTIMGIVAVLCLMLGVRVYAIADAWKKARQKTDYVPRRWQAKGVYLLVFIACALPLQGLLGSYVRAHQLESFRSPSRGMEPALKFNDFVFIDSRYNCPTCQSQVERGDVVLFVYPLDRRTSYIKRVIGLPGERVQILGDAVYVNGLKLKTSEAATTTGTLVTESGDRIRQWQAAWSRDAEEIPPLDVFVPAGQVFLLGDNRNLSQDSRTFGTVPLQDVVGRVRQVWFSYADGAVRWERLGKVVE